MRSLPAGLRAYVLLVASLGAAVVGVALAHAGPLDARAAVLVLLAVGCATRTVPVPGTGVALTAETPFLLALVDAGDGAIAVVAAAAGQALATVANGSWRRGHTVPFNAGAGALGTALAVVVFRGASALVQPMPVLLAGLGAWLGTAACVVGAIRLASGALPGRAWREGVPVTCAAYVASASLAHVIAAGEGLFGSLLLVVPLFVLLQQSYVTHRDRVQERASREAERDEVFLPTLEALTAAIEARDPAAYGHNQRVGFHALGLAHALGHTDEATLTALRYGAILHDIGRIVVPDRLLHSRELLSPEDLATVRRHAVVGADLVRHVPFPSGVLEVVRNHHERWDGGGYPDGLAGEAIPLPARIVAVCDAFDDLCSGGWRRPLTRDEACRVLLEESGTAFDPAIVEGFVRWMSSEAVPDHARTPSMSDANATIRMMSREQAELSDLAFRDELTRLRNGRALQRDLKAAREAGEAFVLLVLDLDGFKGINDHLGHEAGDRALRIVAEALGGLAPPRTAYRNGGDEFVVRIPGAPSAEEEVEAVRASIEARILPVPGGAVRLRTSVGGVVCWGLEPAEALRRADLAMLAVKAERKARDRRPRGAPPEIVAEPGA